MPGHGLASPSRSLERPIELVEAHGKYAADDGARAPHVVVGVVDLPGIGLLGGVLAFARNEIYAHLLRRQYARFECARFGGVGVKRTAHHPEGATFDVEGWRRRVSALPVDSREGCDAALLPGGFAIDAL